MITKKDVRTWLDTQEVDYEKAKELGPEAIPFLMELVQSSDLELASKATYLASLINTEETVEVLKIAIRRNDPVLKVAAAAGIRNLPEIQAEKVIDLLKDEPDAGIRKVMLKSTIHFKSPEIEKKLQNIADKDAVPFVSELAKKVVETMRTNRLIP